VGFPPTNFNEHVYDLTVEPQAVAVLLFNLVFPEFAADFVCWQFLKTYHFQASDIVKSGTCEVGWCDF
jgi:hypothetical protein